MWVGDININLWVWDALGKVFSEFKLISRQNKTKPLNAHPACKNLLKSTNAQNDLFVKAPDTFSHDIRKYISLTVYSLCNMNAILLLLIMFMLVC